MTKRRRILILLACGVLVAVVLWAILSKSSEPYCEGRSLSYWLSVLSDPESSRHTSAEAEFAIRHIGTNAIPLLLEWIRYEPAPWQNELASHLNPNNATFLLSPLTVSRARTFRAHDAAKALKILGPAATPAIPGLVSFINSTNPPYTANLALCALAYFGESGLPPITQVLANASHPLHPTAVWIFRSKIKLGKNLTSLVPLLVQCTKESDPDVVVSAIHGLGYLALQPEISVPAITNHLKHTNAFIRAEAITALLQFQPATASTIRSLTEAVHDPDYSVHGAAVNALLKIAPEALTNAPPK